MEDPASITPLITKKQWRMRAISKEVTDLQHKLQGIADQREEYIQHIRRELLRMLAKGQLYALIEGVLIMGNCSFKSRICLLCTHMHTHAHRL